MVVQRRDRIAVLICKEQTKEVCAKSKCNKGVSQNGPNSSATTSHRYSFSHSSYFKRESEFLLVANTVLT